MKIEKTDKLDFKAPNDLDFKFIEHEQRFNLYKVRYSYKTKRGNHRENFRFLFADDDSDAVIKFLDYIDKFNKENEHRAVFNVKILDTVLLGTVTK